MKYFLKLFIPGVLVLSVLTSGCSISRVEFDQEAMNGMKKVAVILFTVPPSINYRDDPKEPGGKSLIQAVSEAATANNGPRAASVAQKSFIDNINKKGIALKLMTQEEMMSNQKFVAVAKEAYDKIQAEKAKAKAELEKSSVGKALSMLSAFSAATGDNHGTEGAGPEGLPNYGLPSVWKSAESARTNMPGEKEYIMQAMQALGADGALIINDPGMSFSCDACIGGTGSGSTGSAFLVTLVNAKGESILEMRQWFLVSSGDAAMLAYAVNPLQHEGLFIGHGEKMARVFVDYYKEEGGK